ncbi:MAG TPA: FAD-binding oxidoreductase, partial [Streptosporangiaceae bacterium]|nr:FAD-binding oxidoreductase [Streptosporangiaceae bacterium]
GKHLAWVTIRGVDTLNLLASRLPDGAVTTDAEILRERAIDSWALALLRRVRGDELPAPAAVVFPASTQDAATVMAWACQTGTAVIPRGGGSGVCGGAEATAGSVVLDLSRMNAITDVDLTSRVVQVQAGVRGGQLDEALAEHGLTVGHYPQSIAGSTVGGWIAASSAGQASAGFGAIEDVLLGLTAVLPQGGILRCRPVPRSAAGPDLRRLLVGSEGTLAVITEAALACRARPAGFQWLAFGFPAFTALADGLRDAVRAEIGAAVIRGYDEADAQLSFSALGLSGGCVGILGFPAGQWGQQAREELAREIMQRAGASGELGSSYGDHWWQHRNDAVDTYLRIMGPDRAFGPGVVVDTLEVAGLWSAVPRLHEGIRAALAAHSQAVVCHLSHLYSSGSSLYFTFLISGSDDRDAEVRYRAAWEQAARCCAAVGGTLTHHHGVGRLKSRFLAEELGTTGVDVLTKIKAALDPDQIMNPGVLLP